MTQAREPLSIMDTNPNAVSTATPKRPSPIELSRSLAFVILVIFALALVATAFIVYNFAACPKTDPLANVTKHECPICSHPITDYTSVLPLEHPTTTTHHTTTTLAPATEEEQAMPKDVRLPTNIRPDRYYLRLTPYIYEGNFTFDGEVSIVLIVKNDTQQVTFHGVELTFKSIKMFEKADKRAINILNRTEDVARQYHVLHLNETLKAGKQYVLNITYTGILNDNLHGFYRSSYEERNVTKWIAVTQFQATDARRAFPCWDEPSLKARFTISIARPSNMSSVSNMNNVGHQPHEKIPNYTWDHYAESLPMSTYLVAFAVTDFGSMSDQNFTVWARKEALSSAAYALEIGPKILKFLEEYYKIKFPLPKIDMMALPDFKAGAMENWGLLTFREIAMLFDSSVYPTTAKARVAAVVAHEIAHQWFGNLVTPAWWSDIWLNEGFATYVEYVAVDAVETWESMELFVLIEVQSVFKLDALTSSHQISVKVDNPEEIGAIFDKISYGKGAAILRMMNHFLTDDVFNAGITDYLNAKKYGDAEQRDLWSALTNAAHQKSALDADVGVIMDSWTLQTGFPVLSINRNYDTGVVSFKQERFILINSTSNNETAPVWWIPVSYTTSAEKDFKSTRPKLWLRGEREIEVKNISVAKDQWLIANIQLTGFYRINYDERNWRMLIEVLNDPTRFQDIHPINRAQIVDDAMNLALAGRLDYKTALDITSYLIHERSYVPWKAGLAALGYIDAMLSKGAYYLEYKRYLLRLLDGAVKDLDWKVSANESVVISLHRDVLMSTACHLEHVDCLEHAVRMYTNWMLAPNPDDNEIHADLRNTVYCVGIQAGGAREWRFAWERFRAASAPAEREILLNVLGCTRAPYLLYRYLELALRNDSGIRKQDTVRVFSVVAGSGIGQPIAFNFVRANWQRIKDYVGGSVTTLNSILRVVTRSLNQPHELDELKRFIAESCKDLGRTVLQIVESTEANVNWMKSNYQNIVDWLLTADKGQKSW